MWAQHLKTTKLFVSLIYTSFLKKSLLPSIKQTSKASSLKDLSHIPIFSDLSKDYYN